MVIFQHWPSRCATGTYISRGRQRHCGSSSAIPLRELTTRSDAQQGRLPLPLRCGPLCAPSSNTTLTRVYAWRRYPRARAGLVGTVKSMKIPQRLATCLVLPLLALAAVPASAATQTPTSRILSCTTSPTSVTVRWFTANTAANRKITGYGIVTQNYQSPARMYGSRARIGTVHRLTPRTAYRVALYPFVKAGGQTIPTCLAYTKLSSGKTTTPMRAPLITAVTSTDTTISVTWSMNKSATSALPSSYQVWVSPEDAVNANTAATTSMREPLSVNSATVAGLIPGTSYYIGVGTNNAWGQASVGSLIETAQPNATTTTTTVPTTSTTTLTVPAG